MNPLAPAPLPLAPAVGAAATGPQSARPGDWLELAKPRIATMALVTVAAGYLMAAGAEWSAVTLAETLLGAGLVAAGGSALNHYLERGPDSRMHRTRRRPLPGGRIAPVAALALGLGGVVCGAAVLALGKPGVAAAAAALATAFSYVAVYTPMKRLTTWNTVAGAVPGALPPVIGWLAGNPALTPQAGSLFAILFVWQLPHFYSIAWMHREDYARGGFRMLPVLDSPDGRLTGLATLVTAILLIPVTALPALTGATGYVYLAGALPLSVWFCRRAYVFSRDRSHANAKSVLRGSLVYLLGVMALTALDGVAPRLGLLPAHSILTP